LLANDLYQDGETLQVAAQKNGYDLVVKFLDDPASVNLDELPEVITFH
jgi:hypothetical protein